MAKKHQYLPGNGSGNLKCSRFGHSGNKENKTGNRTADNCEATLLHFLPLDKIWTMIKRAPCDRSHVQLRILRPVKLGAKHRDGLDNHQPPTDQSRKRR